MREMVLGVLVVFGSIMWCGVMVFTGSGRIRTPRSAPLFMGKWYRSKGIASADFK